MKDFNNSLAFLNEQLIKKILSIVYNFSFFIPLRPDGEIGRHTGLKILRL